MGAYDELRKLAREVASASASAEMAGVEAAVMYLDLAFEEVVRAGRELQDREKVAPAEEE